MYICIPIREKNIKSLLKQIEHTKEIKNKADLLEIWFDEISDLDSEKLQKIIKASRKPVIYKLQNINGDNFALLESRSFSGIDYIDLDITNSQKNIKLIRKKNPNLKIILSYHNFEETPDASELNKTAQRMIEIGADIVKIATTARDKDDSLKMLSFLNSITSQGFRAICLCMGKFGQLTRTAGHLFANYLMYAPIREAQKTAPGQITVQKLHKIIKFL